MAKIEIKNINGEKVKDITISDSIFKIEANDDALKKMIRLQLDSQRQGSVKTKSRAEVSGGGKKPWKQKGTGRARAGSSRSPLWRHGGHVFALTSRDYTFKINRKERVLALKSALSYKYLELERDSNFTIGSSNDNAFSCNNQLISPKQVEITYQNRTWLIKDLNSEYKTFINNKALNGMVRLNHGDVIFIMGVKIIVLGNMLIYNNPLESVTYNNNLPAHPIEREENPKVVTTEEEEETKLYTENDYFIRSPRFMEVIEKENFILDEPPKNNEQEDMPFILTAGPMITMASSSFVMLLVAFMSMQNGQRDIMSVLPTIAISISMMAGTLLWPTISRSYTKKMNKKKKDKLEKKYNEYLAKKEIELQNISAKQKQILLSNNISSSECYQMIINKSRSLWGRELHQKDFLSLRLGVGRTNLLINYTYPVKHFSVEDDLLKDKMFVLTEKYKYIDGAPIVENLIEKNILAITGRYEYTKPYIDLLLLQIITLHSYYDLKIVILTNEQNEKYWQNIKL